MKRLIPFILFALGSIIFGIGSPNILAATASLLFLGGSVVSMFAIVREQRTRRVNYRFIFGVGPDVETVDGLRAVHHIRETFARHFGGFTHTQGTGGWIPSAVESSAQYPVGELQTEVAHIFDASAFAGSVDVEQLKRDIAPHSLALNCVWVHVEKTYLSAEHFNAQNL